MDLPSQEKDLSPRQRKDSALIAQWDPGNLSTQSPRAFSGQF
ncbi:hypothetical protein CYB_1674 [Synechococcus sp. JA-2-3B'a(2-13)]|nr:hypothetical protein CYB_1674 [Synechococcus sp. JA-2-3B'a(2-13)]